MGLILVLVVLAVFLDLRSAFWVAMGIPVTLLGALFLLPLFGAYLDSIALAAMILVIGIIVDDGIVVAENIWRQRELGMSPVDAAVEGTYSVFKPVLTTIITTMLAFAPMFFMTGILGCVHFRDTAGRDPGAERFVRRDHPGDAGSPDRRCQESLSIARSRGADTFTVCGHRSGVS